MIKEILNGQLFQNGNTQFDFGVNLFYLLRGN